MRGKRTAHPAPTGAGRITPADAGKTHRCGSAHRGGRDHPRGCGENFSAFARKNRSGGSPPRMRGKRQTRRRIFRHSGITPADAGKTLGSRSTCPTVKDHPRGCGENIVKNDRYPLLQGSPPRMRGKPWVVAAPARQSRITPADAGKTSSKMTGTHSCRDHPRGCGENWLCPCFVRGAQGSPPRMRGKPRPACIGGFRRGITPADAGKTSRRRGELQASKDHPRGCGENSECRCRAVCGVGSPPQVRGKLFRHSLFLFRNRITPAGAGKTPCSGKSKTPLQDHPRRCGENNPICCAC